MSSRSCLVHNALKKKYKPELLVSAQHVFFFFFVCLPSVGIFCTLFHPSMNNQLVQASVLSCLSTQLVQKEFQEIFSEVGHKLTFWLFTTTSFNKSYFLSRISVIGELTGSEDYWKDLVRVINQWFLIKKIVNS